MEQAGRALSTWNRGLSGTVRNSLSTRILTDLFDRIHAILGVKFTDVFNGAEPEVVRQEWSAALADFKPIELERGLAELAKRRFPPTLGEFCCLCRPILDHEWAFHWAGECLRQRDHGMVGDWTHPALWRAASTMSMEVRQGDYAKVRARWKVQLEKELSFGWGEAVPDPPLRLGNDVKVTNDSPTALRERARIREMLRKAKGGDDAQA